VAALRQHTLIRCFLRAARLIDGFLSHPSMAGLGSRVAARSLRNRIALSLTAVLRTTSTGNACLILLLVLFYPHWRRPSDQDAVFCYAPGARDRRLFARVEATLGQTTPRFDIHGRAVRPAERLRAVAPSRLAAMGELLRRHAASDPFTHLQMALALTTGLVMWDERLGKLPLVAIHNDHSPPGVMLVLMATAAGSPTLYVQHAAVTAAILSNVVSARLYLDKSRTTNRPPPRMMTLPPATRARPMRVVTGRVRHVGICTNAMSNPAVVRALALRLSSQAGVETVRIRPHPRDRQRPRLIGLSKKIRMSDPTEPPADFLPSLDLTVVGKSSIVLESLHGGVPVLYDNTIDQGPEDYYGFLRRGLVMPIGETLPDGPELNAFYDNGWRRRFAEFDPSVEMDVEELAKALRDDMRGFLATTRGDTVKPVVGKGLT
jgi:hypothetical protein